MTDTANLELMWKIHAEYSVAIAEACKTTAIPAAFVAALIANESGGNPDAKRFEKNVLADLWEVLLGRKANFGSIRRTQILDFIYASIGPSTTDASGITPAMQRLDGLATSWGLTQIMGYHILEQGLIPVHAVDPESMAAVQMSLHYTIALLERFAKQFRIDERLEFEKLFRCWNTGEPAGKTFDLGYVPNGLARVKLYDSLPAPGQT
jgi:hypothetical protein